MLHENETSDCQHQNQKLINAAVQQRRRDLTLPAGSSHTACSAWRDPGPERQGCRSRGPLAEEEKTWSECLSESLQAGFLRGSVLQSSELTGLVQSG